MEKGLDTARENLLGCIAEINEIGKKYDSVYDYFNIPKGQASMENEIENSLAARREGEAYEPQFVFPKLAKINAEELANDIARLEGLKEKVLGEDSADVKEVALEINSNFVAKIRILEALGKGDKEAAFRESIKAYGDIDDAFVARAWEAYEHRLCRNPEDKSEVQKQMEDMRFDADALKKYLDIALAEMGE